MVDGLVPRLIGLDRQRERLVKPVKLTAPPPLIEVIGGRLAGKTLLLDELYEGYRNRIPLAQVDLADARLQAPATPDVGHSATASPVVRLLYLLAYLLGRYVPGYGELRFQRLLLGLLVVSVWHHEHSDDVVMPEDFRAAEADLRTFLRRAQERRARRDHQQALGHWLAALGPVLRTILPPLFGMGPAAQQAVRAVVATVTSRLRTSRQQGRAIAWWGQRLRADLRFQGDDLQCLFDLARHFPPHGRSLPGAEVLLLQALLADISDYYGPVRRYNRRHPPLILLDNLHSPVGAYLRQPLARAYAAEEVRVHPVIVATSLGRPSNRQQSIFEQGARALPSPGDPSREPLRLGIPRIAPTLIAERVRRRCDDWPQLAPMIAELSGGRPGWAGWLVDAMVKELPAETSPESLPMLTAPVITRFLEQLYPHDPELREDLTLLASALDSRSAHWLWAHHGPDVSGREGAARMSRVLDELAARHWRREIWPWPAGEPTPTVEPPGPAIPFVGDRGLRTLLLANLARGYPASRWRQIHERLRAGYLPAEPLPDAVGHSIAYLHHTLALADVETVVRVLHARLRTTEAARWLTAVNVICAAPVPPDGLAPTPGMWLPTGEDDLLRGAVQDLVFSLWRASDPFAVPGPVQHDRIRSALWDLHRGLHAEEFRAAASRWPEKLAEGLRAPDLPVSVES